MCIVTAESRHCMAEINKHCSAITLQLKTHGKVKLFDSGSQGLKATLYSSTRRCLLHLSRNAFGQGH